MGVFYPGQPEWLSLALGMRFPVRERVLDGRRAVLVRSPEAFQGWRVEDPEPAPDVETPLLAPGDSALFAFGESLTGHLGFDLAAEVRPNHSPVRLRIELAEVPLELGEAFPSGEECGIGTAWRQEEVVVVDELPARVELPRRFSFRYARITWAERVSSFRVRLSGVTARRITTAPLDNPPPPAVLAPADLPLYEVACRTLRNCMHKVFEDGPKRDRRLWLGDLRLQALVNGMTFRSYPLVKRCLYLLAGMCSEDGQVPAAVFDHRQPEIGDFIFDYSILFGAVLLDYARASGDRETAAALFEVAERQGVWALERLNPEDGKARDAGWVFIDWKDGLDKSAALVGVAAYGLERLRALAGYLGRTEAEARWAGVVAAWRSSARKSMWRAEPARVVSGPEAQLSYASWAWWTLGNLLDAPEAAAAYRHLEGTPDAVRPGGPYVMHHVADAMIECGLAAEAAALVRRYWGGMIEMGLDTFPEVWDATDPRRGPYGTPLLNSYCHAWSCTPPWLLVKALRLPRV